MVRTICTCSTTTDGCVQSTEKFMSAAKPDGFGFCSVILQATIARVIVHTLTDIQWMGSP